MTKNKAIFIDRDGVINFDRDDYVKSTNEVILIPNVEKYLKILKDSGFLIVIISNQSSVGRGIISNETLNKINSFITMKLEKLGSKIDGIYCCTHLPSENCDCRKPKDGLLKLAAQELDIELKNSWMVGDKNSDVLAGNSVGCKTIQIDRNSSLSNAVSYILKTDSIN